MGVFDSLKSRLRNNDEEEFERAFREGRFPEGVDDFEPLSNTGNFNPVGDGRPRQGGAGFDEGQPRGRSPRIVEFTARSDGSTPPLHADEEDDGIQVFERTEERPRRTASAPSGAKPFKERFQERAAEGQRAAAERVAYRQQARPASEPEPREADEPRRPRDSKPQQPRVPASEPAAEPRPAPRPPLGKTLAPIALPTQSVVVRGRTIDDASQIADVVMNRHQPVVLLLRGASSEVTRRLLDFSFGLCCGSGAQLSQLEDRVFCVLPRGTALDDRDLASLRRQQILRS